MIHYRQGDILLIKVRALPAHAAVASTWRDDKGAMLFKRPDQYRPAVET